MSSGVFVSTGVGEGVGVAVGAAEAVGVGEGTTTGVGDGDGIGFTTGFTETPLFQTNFFPDLTHVYFFPARVEVAPTFTHLDPAFGVAACKGDAKRANANIDAISARRFLMVEKYGTTLTVGNTSPTIV